MNLRTQITRRVPNKAWKACDAQIAGPAFVDWMMTIEVPGDLAILVELLPDGRRGSIWTPLREVMVATERGLVLSVGP